LLKAVLLESNSVSALAIPKVTVLDTVGTVSLLAVTALTKRRWLWWVALVSTTAGTLMGLAGLISDVVGGLLLGLFCASIASVLYRAGQPAPP